MKLYLAVGVQALALWHCKATTKKALTGVVMLDGNTGVDPGSGSGASLAGAKITDVHGDTADGAGGYFVQSGVVIDGQGLDADPNDYWVSLVDPAGPLYPLVVTSATSTSISATLPDGFTTSSPEVQLQVTSKVTGETLTVNVSLAPGPAGPTGPTGDPGVAGATGADGVSGGNGVNGATGKAGATGPPGPTGAPGSTGNGNISNVTVSAPLSVLNPTTTPAISMSQATTTTNGWLSSADWNTFNGKGSATVTSVAPAATVGNPISVANQTSTPTIDIAKASALTNGYLAAADWSAFNAKGSGNGTVTTVSATAPLAVATPTTTPALSISQATTSASGYVSSTDWNTFNGKGAGTVSTMTASAPLSVSTPTTTPALTIAQATTTTSGFVSAANWTTFNNKVTSVSGTAPITVTGTTARTVAMTQASGAQSGYLAAADWTTFNNKGTVTSMSATPPLAVATPTTTPAVSLSASCSAPMLWSFDGASWGCRSALANIRIPPSDWAVWSGTATFGSTAVGSFETVAAWHIPPGDYLTTAFIVPQGRAGVSPNARFVLRSTVAGTYNLLSDASGIVAGQALPTCFTSGGPFSVTLAANQTADVMFPGGALTTLVCGSSLPTAAGDLISLRLTTNAANPGNIDLLDTTVEY